MESFNEINGFVSGKRRFSSLKASKWRLSTGKEHGPSFRMPTPELHGFQNGLSNLMPLFMFWIVVTTPRQPLP
jgi:hypothetical protein